MMNRDKTNAQRDAGSDAGTEQESPALEAEGGVDDLHDLFTVPAEDSEDPLAGLRDDPNYAALIRDLEYIAREARQLFEDPSDSVWDKIQTQIDIETPKK